MIVVYTVAVLALFYLFLHHFVLLRSDPNEPQLVRGYLPFIGVGLSLNSDPINFLLSLRKQYGKVFTLWVAGKRMVVLSDPKSGIAELWKASRSCPFRPVSEFFDISVFGWSQRMVYDDDVFNHTKNSTVKLMRNAKQVASLTSHFTECARQKVEQFYVESFPKDGKIVDLTSFTDDTVIWATLKTFFGYNFPAEKLIMHFQAWDKGLPELVRKYPKFAISKVYNAREEMQKVLADYMRDPNSGISTGSDIMKDRDEILQNLGYDADDRAKNSLGMLFASLANAVPACFWTLSHIICEESGETAGRLRDIIGRNYDYKTKTINFEEIYKNEYFYSICYETIRIYGNICSARAVEKDTVIRVENDRSIVLKKDQMVMVPSQLVHMDPEIYPRPTEWLPERFMKKNDGKLRLGDAHWKTFLNWGGGSNKCVGETLALQEIMTYVVFMLWNFDIEPLGKPKACDVAHRFGMGVMHAEPLPVRMKKRIVDEQIYLTPEVFDIQKLVVSLPSTLAAAA